MKKKERKKGKKREEKQGKVRRSVENSSLPGEALRMHSQEARPFVFLSDAALRNDLLPVQMWGLIENIPS